MSRLIDADALEKEWCSGCQYEKNKYANCIDCALANAPTIELEHSEIVYCKDCVFFTTGRTCCHPEGLLCAMPDSFCSYGEVYCVHMIRRCLQEEMELVEGKEEGEE